MKITFITLITGLFTGIISAQNSVFIDFAGVERNGGKVYVSLFNSEKSY